MNSLIATRLAPLVLLAGLVMGASPATAAAHAHGCKVVSVTTAQQSRNINGMVIAVVNGHPVYGHGVQHRTATTTVTKCKGQTTSAVIYTAWA